MPGDAFGFERRGEHGIVFHRPDRVFLFGWSGSFFVVQHRVGLFVPFIVLVGMIEQLLLVACDVRVPAIQFASPPRYSIIAPQQHQWNYRHIYTCISPLLNFSRFLSRRLWSNPAQERVLWRQRVRGKSEPIRTRSFRRQQSQKIVIQQGSS